MAKSNGSVRSQQAQERYDRFIAEYLKDRNASRAAKAVGYAPKSAHTTGNKLLKHPYIAPRVAQKAEEAIKRAEIEAEEVLRLNWQRATADVNSVIQMRRGACRYCHGKKHEYQWRTRAEFDAAFVEAAFDLWPNIAKDDNARRVAHSYLEGAKEADLVEPVHPGMPTLKGGLGYRASNEPHADCPYCEGMGIEQVHIPDTRSLSEDGLALYEGVEETKEGRLKIKLADRGASLNRVAQIMGLYKADMTVTPGAGWGELLAADIGSGALGFTPPTGRLPKNAQRVLDEDDEVEP